MNKRVTQYIAEYDEEKSENENENENFIEDIEALIFDASSENSSTTKDNDEAKNFIATFGFINYAEFMIIKLNNKFFTHSLNAGTKNEPIIAEIDPFAYISIERYISKEFYDVMINTEASRHSTTDYGQYLVYKTIENVNIDESKTNAINV